MTGLALSGLLAGLLSGLFGVDTGADDALRAIEMRNFGKNRGSVTIIAPADCTIPREERPDVLCGEER
jgi:hypothetical protein